MCALFILLSTVFTLYVFVLISIPEETKLLTRKQVITPTQMTHRQ